jgi:hypothetical protein
MGAALYGDPCRECGFGWKLTPEQAVTVVRAAPGSYKGWLARATGRERHPDLLAQARRYDDVSLAGLVLQHATRGPQRAGDVARNNAHDTHHHLWDIGGIMRAR